MNEQIISALIGLAGACNNNGKTPNTDAVVLNALYHCTASADAEAIAEAVRREKFAIAPGCADCACPCGNTSDYDMEKLHSDPELGTVKEELMNETVFLALRLHEAGCTEAPDILYEAISFLGYDLDKDAYTQLIDTIRHTEG